MDTDLDLNFGPKNIVPEMAAKPGITLLVCTYNRAEALRRLLETALDQETDDGFSYNILVADNNSTDGTRELVEGLINEGHENLSYLFVKKQGKSYALTSALDSIDTTYYAIIDDDFILPNDYVQKLIKGFREHPEAAYISGKVLPSWENDPPAWLTKEHWSAIAVADYGDKEFIADENNRICLLACAFKTDVVRSIGGYNIKLGVNGDQIGGTEDYDISIRLWEHGEMGVYLPNIWFHHVVTPVRFTRDYHRRWHYGHGQQNALMKDPEFEKASFYLFGVPGHLYRQSSSHLLKWLKYRILGDDNNAFLHETHLRFFHGFFSKRYTDRKNARTKE